jgi:SHS2 domain-containing protein
MLKYEFVEHTADLTFKACGRDLNKLFENAAEALESTLIMLEGVALRETTTIEMTSTVVKTCFTIGLRSFSLRSKSIALPLKSVSSISLVYH